MNNSNSSRVGDVSHSTPDDNNTSIIASPTEAQASGEAQAPTETRASGSSAPQTRVACDACRDRKIRCNRHRPICGRCIKLGITCRYSSRSTLTPSKLDLSRILMTMNNRLQQAEAQLASSSITLNPQSLTTSRGTDMGPPSNSNPPMLSTASSTELYDLGMISENMPAAQTLTDRPEQTNVNYLDFQFDTFGSEMSVDQIDYMLHKPMLDGNQPIYTDPMLINNLLPSPHHLPQELSTELLQRLRDICFDVYRPMLSMVDHTRFEAEISQPSPSIQAQALSYAIGALGAFSVPELHCHVERCYQQSRILLDLCERQESGESLTSINTLQACTLLTLYELKQPNFGRAWMSLGRAIRLAKMMGLDQEDSHPGMVAQWYPSTKPIPLSSPAEAEERRRTFWILYILDAFTSTSTKTGLAFNDQIVVALPGPDAVINDFVKTGLMMPSLSRIFDSNIPRKITLSSFAGVAIMVYLYQRCANHIKSSSHQQSHNFWETHYGINKSIDFCRGSLLMEHLNGNSSDDPVSLALRMCVDTVDIMLHECAMLKAQKDDLPTVLVADAISKCTSAATDIVDSLQMGQQLTGRRRKSFQQLGNFHAWPITTAIQICCCILYHGSDNVSPYINCIRILSSSTTTKTLIDQQLIDPGLLEKAESCAVAAE